MIPVFQTRTATERLGNCLEACLASILELPLSAIPDRADYLPAGWAETVAAAGDRAGDLELDLSGWADEMQAWLRERGLGLLELEVRDPREWLETMAHAGYWIGEHRTAWDSTHAVVYLAGEIVHNPMRGMLAGEGLARLVAARVLLVADARLIVRELGSEMLPDLEALAG